MYDYLALGFFALGLSALGFLGFAGFFAITITSLPTSFSRQRTSRHVDGRPDRLPAFFFVVWRFFLIVPIELNRNRFDDF